MAPAALFVFGFATIRSTRFIAAGLNRFRRENIGKDCG